MMRAVMESAGLVLWPVASLVLFNLFAVGLGLWLYRRGSKPFYEDMARLALETPSSAREAAGAREGGR
jgi:hypothetical protein